MNEYVTANSYFVWTDKAQKANPQRSVAGQRVWEHYAIAAPSQWLADGLIIDSSEYIADGQADLFDYIEG